LSDITPDPNPSDSYSALLKGGYRAPGQKQSPEAASEGSEGATTAAVFAVGDYLVGDAEDSLLNGHPDIRY
jgi:hypothetical protein